MTGDLLKIKLLFTKVALGFGGGGWCVRACLGVCTYFYNTVFKTFFLINLFLKKYVLQLFTFGGKFVYSVPKY